MYSNYTRIHDVNSLEVVYNLYRIRIRSLYKTQPL
jgi:hypothetical protein